MLEKSIQDPEARAEWDRTQLATSVSVWLLRYRKEHGLTQTELARQLGWKQPSVARLESGEHEPSFATLHHLVQRLGATARIEIAPDQVQVRFVKRLPRGRAKLVQRDMGPAMPASESRELEREVRLA